MKKNIHDLKMKRETKFEFSETLNDVTIQDAHVNTVQINFTLELIQDEVIIEGTYKTVVKTPCVRCLDEISIPLSGTFLGHYKESKSYKAYIDSLSREFQTNGDIIEELISDEVDITNLIRDHIILDLPQFPTCNPECNGLEEMEKYSNNGIDSRWQQLLNLKN